MKIKENITLWIALAVPVLMVVFVAGSIYLPRVLSDEQPTTDFLYKSGEDGRYPAEVRYVVRDGTLMREEITYPEGVEKPFYPRPEGGPVEAAFFVHDVETNLSREVTFEEATALTLSTNSKSPDGFTIVPGSRTDFPFFFSGNDYNQQFLKGKYYTDQLNIETVGNADYYYPSFQFLGWILN